MIFSLLDQIFHGFSIKTMQKIFFLSKFNINETKNSKNSVLAQFSLCTCGWEYHRPENKEFAYFDEISVL